jgi:hypothetical protein
MNALGAIIGAPAASIELKCCICSAMLAAARNKENEL